MPFTITPKSATAAHAMAQGAEDFEDNEPDSQMATGADKPLRSDDDAAKGVRNHPDTGRFMGSEETAYGATSPLHTALAQHRAPAALATLETAGAPAQTGSIAPGEVRLQTLDYRGAMGPLAVNPSPVRPPFHQSSNQPSGGQS